MARLKLTKSVVDAAQPQAQAVELRDTQVPGFLCKITPTGRKVFMLQYRTNAGERRKPALGLFGELTVEQARSLAQDWLAEIRWGGDPVRCAVSGTGTDQGGSGERRTSAPAGRPTGSRSARRPARRTGHADRQGQPSRCTTAGAGHGPGRRRTSARTRSGTGRQARPGRRTECRTAGAAGSPKAKR